MKIALYERIRGHYIETILNEPFPEKYSDYTNKEVSELYNDESSGADIEDLCSLRFQGYYV